MCRRVKLLTRRFAPSPNLEFQLYYNARKDIFCNSSPHKKIRKRASWRAMENWSHFLCSKQETHGTFGGPFMRPKYKRRLQCCSSSPVAALSNDCCSAPIHSPLFSLFCGVIREIRRGVVGARNDQARSSKMMTFGGGQ